MGTDKYDDLTPLEVDGLLALKRFIRQNQWAPTIREFAALLGLRTPSWAQSILQGLQEKGYIESGPGSRMIKFTLKGKEALSVIRRRLTPREMDGLLALKQFIAEHKWPPTVQEFTDLLGVRSKAWPYNLLQILKKKGYIEMGPGVRSIRLTAKGEQELEITPKQPTNPE